MDLQELKERQAWPLKQKIDHALYTIETFTSRMNGQCYVAFSGGKDSTVLLDLVRIIDKDIPAVFVNTGNEYPDIIKFVRHLRDDKGYNILEIHPKMKPKQVWAKYGFPLVSKEQAECIHAVRVNPNSKKSWKALNTTWGIADRWRFLVDEEFETDNKCCNVLKKAPSKKYEKETGRHPILGTMASESVLREKQYLKKGGCNYFGERGRGSSSAPLSIWTDDDIWAYIKERNLEISPVYHLGAKRTGCVGCGFGCYNTGDKRFELLYRLYPRYYETIMKYQNNGVTFREAVRKVLAVTGMELPDESGEIFFNE